MKQTMTTFEKLGAGFGIVMPLLAYLLIELALIVMGEPWE